jgi:hypothetical protein
MPYVRYTLNILDLVASAKQAEEDFDFIDIWRAETKWGSYSKITNNNSHIEVCCQQNYYDYDDYSGSEYYWYRFQLVGSGTGDPISQFSQPTQAYIPNTTYCGLDAVRRLLKSQENDRMIRFSEYYRNIRKATDSQSVSLGAISINPEYAGRQEFVVTFLDATDFKLEVGEESQIAKQYLGQGDINTDFIASDYSIRINKDDWSGIPVMNDRVLFETDSHMSTSDAIKFIQDAETLVDVILEENIAYLQAKDSELRFERGDVPKAIIAATARFAAFFIYSTIYNQQTIPGLPGNINDITSIAFQRENDFSTLPKQAMRYLQGFITKYKEFFNPETGEALASAPRFISFGTFFDASGVYGVGEGLKLPEKDKYFEQTLLVLEGLLDWDLMINAVEGDLDVEAELPVY